MMDRHVRASMLFALGLAVSACAGSIPAEWEQKVQRGINLRNLQQNLEAHKGQVVLLGGELLDVRDGAGEETVEVLQRPLNSWDQPVLIGESEGRFVIKLSREITLGKDSREGAPLTVVGEVTGDIETRSDKGAPSPILMARYLRVWSSADYVPRSRPVYYYDPYFHRSLIILRHNR